MAPIYFYDRKAELRKAAMRRLSRMLLRHLKGWRRVRVIEIRAARG
jgi:hypothetical protein